MCVSDLSGRCKATVSVDSRVAAHVGGADLSVSDDLVDGGGDLVGVVVETVTDFFRNKVSAQT